MATTAKTSPLKRVRQETDATSQRTLAQELSDIFDVLRQQATLFPDLTERVRIALTLKSGERLELEFTGRNENESTLEDYGHVCLGHDFEITELSSFYSIEELNLSPSTKSAAEKLLKQFPVDVKFTSGRRDISEQAAAMASNVVKYRKWIEKTYVDTAQRAALQKWVDDNPKATTTSAIATGLEGVMNSWSEDQKRRFSRHFTGDAFDLLPVDNPLGEEIIKAIKELPNYHKFFPSEGGIEIWHAQFNA